MTYLNLSSATLADMHRYINEVYGGPDGFKSMLQKEVNKSSATQQEKQIINNSLEDWNFINGYLVGAAGGIASTAPSALIEGLGVSLGASRNIPITPDYAIGGPGGVWDKLAVNDNSPRWGTIASGAIAGAVAGMAIGIAGKAIWDSSNPMFETAKQTTIYAVGLIAGDMMGKVIKDFAMGSGQAVGFLSGVGSAFAGAAIMAQLASIWDDIETIVNNQKAMGFTQQDAMEAISQAFHETLADAFSDPETSIIDDYIGTMGQLYGLLGTMAVASFLPNELINALDAAHQGQHTPPPGGAPRLGNESPLVIDLDGDGIELTDALTDAVYWDVDNDGFRDASAWVKADDALLVMDRNNNGTIDNHSELFGNQVDGFEVLSELDSNQDGKINSSDAQFVQLKIWQDLNQDGVSQANELKTLTEAGIQSIDLNAQSVNYQVANNDITSTSFVTMTDGSTRTIVDAWFKYNDANTIYDGEYDLDMRTLYLPMLRGYGEVKDLTIAMSLNEDLLQQVTTLSQMTLHSVLNTAGDFDGKFREMLYEWSNIPKSYWADSAFQYDLRKTQFLDDLSGRNYTDGAVIAGNTYTYEPTMLVEAWQAVLTNLEARFLSQTVFSGIFTGDPVYNINTDTVEGITGISATGLADVATIINGSSDKIYGWTLFARVVHGTIGIDNLSGTDESAINTVLNASISGLTIDELKDSVDKGLADVPATGTPGTDSTVVGDGSDNIIEGRDGNDTLWGGGGDDRMYGQQGNDIYHGGSGDDFMFEGNVYSSDDTYHYEGGDDIIVDVYGYDKIVMMPGITLDDIKLTRVEVAGSLGLNIDVEGHGSIFVMNNWDAYGNNSRLDRIEFSDSTFLTAAYIDGVINGTSGNDILVGADNASYERDHIIGGDGNDTINGGAGNDYLEGEAGDDTYIYDYYTGAYSWSSWSGYDIIYDFYGEDTLILKNIAPGEVKFKVVGDDYGSLSTSLVIEVDEEWVVKIEGQFNNAGINTIVFDGYGVSIDVDTYSFDQENESHIGKIMVGVQYGGSQDNRIFGGSGEDILRGGYGDDLLNGGFGADRLEGGSGDDTYVYVYGASAQGNAVVLAGDLIDEESGYDVLVLENVDSPFITIERNADGSSLNVDYDGFDIIVVANHFQLNKGIEAIQFGVGGSIWDISNIRNVLGDSGNNTLTGLDNSLMDDDVIYGYAGNDTLTGGLGNDILYGGADNDTYYYTSGLDTIDEQYAGGSDTLQFGGGILASHVRFEMAANRYDLNVYIHEVLSVVIKNQFVTDGTIETLRFSDNSTLNLANYNYILNGTSGYDTIYAPTTGTGGVVINGYDGGDTIYAYATDDVVNGGAGFDTVYAGEGNDRLIYSISENVGANDYYYGQVGTDTLEIYVQSGDITDAMFSDLLAYKTYLSNPANINTSDNYGTMYNFSTFYLSVGSVEQLKVFIDGAETNISALNPIIGTAAANTLSGTTGNDIIFGKDGNDTITGGNGSDFLIGGVGADAMTGGSGDDTYVVDNSSDTTVESAGGGTDTVLSLITRTLATEVENLTLIGSSAINGTGNGLANIIIGNSAANTLDGGTGADTLKGGLGSDTYVVDNTSDIVIENSGEGVDLIQSSVTYTLPSNVENITLTGTSAINAIGNSLDNIIIGNSVANTLTGYAGNDTLNGGLGADTMIGGIGDDTYVVDNVSDIVTELANEGIDTIQSSITITSLVAHVENIMLTGTAAINATGNALDNIITGNTGNNTLNGGDGNDTINGGGGTDTMVGGLGDDIYIVDSTTDVVTEAASAGTDTIRTSVALASLAANVENLVLLGTVASAVGNSLNNTITGNSSANTLNGGAGNDTMIGGAGNDTYTVDSVSDIVVELVNEGTDTVSASVSYTLSANVENLTLTGTSAINATGNTANNTLTGNSGNNIIIGAGGEDTMIGGAGNDTYIVDSAGDVVTESASSGTDLVKSSITYTLTANVENLILLGYSNINGTGNTLANILTGNSGNNILNGGAGNDTLIGGIGDDTYIVDSTSDVITENANEGNDSVQSSSTYTLSANVENITLTGTSTINATGNALDNVITGNSANNTLTGGDGNDTLIGGGGVDTMIGGNGNDTYVVDSTTDIVTEATNAGIDMIKSSVTLTSLAANVENLTLTGTSAINGTGNALNNSIVGNSANNTLSGGDGNDTLYGGSGNDTLQGGNHNDLLRGDAGLDTLTGGAGADTFEFRAESAFSDIDVITDFNTGQNDALNIADLLTGYTSGVSDINDFCSIVTSGSNSQLFIDRDGTGSTYSSQQIATLNGVTGLDVDTLLLNNNLIAA